MDFQARLLRSHSLIDCGEGSPERSHNPSSFNPVSTRLPVGRAARSSSQSTSILRWGWLRSRSILCLKGCSRLVGVR
jgi:hypothetical protein